jgi:thioredoxin-like negative regulator of GroEL
MKMASQAFVRITVAGCALRLKRGKKGCAAPGTWKRALAGCLLAFLFAALSHAAAAPQSIPWITDYTAALEQAKTESKPVLVDFTAAWCTWCKRLDDDVYADASAVNALKDFVCVKVDVDQHPNVALAYNVQTMPRMVVLNVYGEIIGDVTGYQPLGSFLEFLAGLKEDLSRKTGGTATPAVSAAAGPVQPQKPAIAPETPTDEILVLLGDRDPAVRGAALRVINDKPERRQLLVAALASEALGTRIAAYEALHAESGDMPFDPWANKSERESALPKWKQWVEGNASSPAPR